MGTIIPHKMQRRTRNSIIHAQNQDTVAQLL